jgi:hypothetical protein
MRAESVFKKTTLEQSLEDELTICTEALASLSADAR